jgi:alanine racemase
MTRPILATIHPAAVAHNLTVARRHAPHSFQWAVVKANAYGHGIERVFAGLHGADGLALLDFAEAQQLRALGWTKPILMLEGCFDAGDIATCAALNLTPMLHSAAQLALHADYANRGLHTKASEAAPLPVQVKVNSGMNRLGFALRKLPQVAAQLAQQVALRHFSIVQWVTHFADADVVNAAGQSCAAAPLAAFEAAMQAVFEHHPSLIAPLSTSNSAAIGTLPAAHHAAVRSGIMSYGSSPYGHANPLQTAAALGLQPAMTLSSRLIAVQHLLAGDTVGYASTFTATAPLRIGTVACGYADGYPRHAPTGTPIAVDGVLTRTLGRVSMDMIAVDLSPVPHAAVGSAVELWGARVPIDAVAHAAGTVGYELMCALAQRVPTVTAPAQAQ